MNSRLSWITAVGVVVLGTSGCASAPDPAPGSPSSSARPSVRIAPAQLIPRTVQEVRSALIELGDLPAGFAIQPASRNDDNRGAASSRDPNCTALVRHLNTKASPGSTASARISFSGGRVGPLVSESIEALGSEHNVEQEQASFRSAVADCRHVTIKIAGQGRSTMLVAQVSAPSFGDHAVAFRMTADGGRLDGLEITEVTSGVADVLVSISFVAAIPDDVDGTTKAAIDKAREVLGGNPSPA